MRDRMSREWSLNKVKLIVWSLVFMLIVAPVSAVSANQDTWTEEELQHFERYAEIYQYLKEYHVSAPSSEQLTEWAITGMIFSLEDPYTYVLTDEETQELFNAINGDFVGVGIILSFSEQGVMIEDVISFGPAAKAGLQRGDMITHVDGQSVEDALFIEDVTMLIAGEAGQPVTLTVKRTVNQQEETKTFTMNRAPLTIPLVEQRMLDEKVGYVKLTSFGEQAGAKLGESIFALQAQGMEQMILDLRGNSGGYMQAAIDVAKLFKESGVLLYSKDNAGNVHALEFDNGQTFDQPLVVLIDEGTASASEVVAGFLKDEGIGVVMGDISYGKGTVQDIIPLETGGYLRISVEEYFSPSMKPVNLVGIEPNIEVTNRDFHLAKAYGYLTEKEEIHIHQDGSVLFNGMDASKLTDATYQHDGKMYLSTRTIAQWYNGEVDWDRQAKAVELSLFGKEYKISSKNEALALVKSKSFIDVNEISKHLPLVAEQVGDTLVIKKK